MTGKQLVITASVHAAGPLFDGRAAEAVTRFTQDATKAIAERGADMLRDVPMNKSGRSRGGFKASLHVVQRGAAFAVPGPMIRGVTWAPWLEGSSKRNQGSKFRGYKLFARTAAELDGMATGIAEQELRKFLPEMGGAP